MGNISIKVLWTHLWILSLIINTLIAGIYIQWYFVVQTVQKQYNILES